MDLLVYEGQLDCGMMPIVLLFFGSEFRQIKIVEIFFFSPLGEKEREHALITKKLFRNFWKLIGLQWGEAHN